MRMTTTVGFEFEYSGSTLVSVERLLRDRNINCTRPGSWHRSDGSVWDLKTDSTCGWEVASPILETYEQLVEAAHVGALITTAGGSVNSTCGFHVHIGARGLNRNQLENIFRFMTRYEAAFFLIVPPVRRNCQWCKRLPLETVRSLKHADFTRSDWWDRAWHDKNVWLNGKRYPDIKTIEFRIMPGTLDPHFIIGYVTFLQCMINTVKDRKICWGSVKSKDDRSMFQTMLGQSGFYGPWTTPEQKELYVTGRKWAIERYNVANRQELRLATSELAIPSDYRTTRLVPNIPTVDVRPPWALTEQAGTRVTPRRRSPRRQRPEVTITEVPSPASERDPNVAAFEAGATPSSNPPPSTPGYTGLSESILRQVQENAERDAINAVWPAATNVTNPYVSITSAGTASNTTIEWTNDTGSGWHTVSTQAPQQVYRVQMDNTSDNTGENPSTPPAQQEG